MKKKLFMLLMATSLVLTACGGKTEEAEEAEAVIEETEVEDVAEIEEVEEAVEATEETEEVEETEEAAEEVEETEEVDFAKGTITEEGWESEWIGIRYTTPEGATMATEDEINEMMGLGKEVLSEDFSDLQIKYAELNSVYEMMCYAADGATNVIISVEKLSKEMDVESYIQMFENTISQVSSMDYEILSNDEVVTIGEVEFNKISCAADYEGVQLCQDYYVRIIGDRTISLTVTYVDAAAAEEMMNGFAAY